jgi:hypothetical protein
MIALRTRSGAWSAAALAGFLTAALALAGGPLVAHARAEAPEWHLEQPLPPEPSPGVPPASTPIGLGQVGDIEFWAPNRGLLITHGNGKTIPAGIWVYNGQGWHELAEVCGATEGRIAWAAANEFWTVSDGRPGQPANPEGQLPPLEDDTLCHFGETGRETLGVIASYAKPAFQADSYEAMQAAACLSPTDCWFGGGRATPPYPKSGAFELHWNGNAVEAEPDAKAHTVGDMRAFEGSLYQTLALPLEEEEQESESAEEIEHPYVLDEIASEPSNLTFKGIRPRSPGLITLPEYAPPSGEFPSGSYPQALEYLHLGASEGSLWAAAGPVPEPPLGSGPGELTVLRDASGVWSQVLGPEGEASAEGEAEGTGAVTPETLEEDVVRSIAPEPGGSGAWLALDSYQDSKSPSPTALATVVHVSTDGTVSEEQLPSQAEREQGVSPKGGADRISCPAVNDCWLSTTQGWLFHLSQAGQRTLPADTDPAFNGPLITYRPHDEGIPEVIADAPPEDDSGVSEESAQANAAALAVHVTPPENFARVTVPLLSEMHTRLIHGSTLELTFHLSARARVRLIAKRHSKVVASSPTRTFAAGKRSLELRLNRKQWPTKLNLQTKALAPLPTVSTRSSGVESVSTSLVAPNRVEQTAWGSLQSNWGPSL